MPVYLRLTHNFKVAYIKTQYVVNTDGLTRNGEVKDSYVLRKCMELIEEYAARLNSMDTSGWKALQVKQFLVKRNANYSFTRFADSFIDRMERAGSVNNAQIYRAAMKSLKQYLHTDNIGYDLLSRENILSWVSFLEGRTKRAKTLYPTCVRLIYKEAMLASQEPDSQVEPIMYNPWARISIPASDVPRKKAISVKECRKFFNFEITSSAKGAKKAQIGRDVALLSFCLAGINTVDLYKLRKGDLKNNILSYCRSKTSGRRKDGAFIEMRVTPMAAQLIDKYRASDEDERLLSFGQSYSSSLSFAAYVDSGITRVCEMLGMRKEDYYSLYTFRHTWATIANNDCGASLSEVGFAMNHLQGDGVTRGYIKPDFTPAWELNERVQNFVFAPQLSATAKEIDAASDIGLTPSTLFRVAVFAGGKCLLHFDDIGLSSVDAVVDKVRGMLPAEDSDNAWLTIKIVNCDNGKVYVYEHQKGKGF